MEVLGSFESPPAAVVLAPLPFYSRINYAIRLWAMKIAVKVLINVMQFLKPSPASERPTYTKVYPVLPMITNRVFIPNSYKPGDKALPLYIDIHGGGFTLCDPRVDDDRCSYLAHKHGICVVSIGYRRAPRFPFPTPVMDCAALAQAILDDKDLPCDMSKVAMGGYSAGANMSLAATQLDGLRGKIAGVVAFYPVVDFTRSGEVKMRTRPVTPGKTDMLVQSGKWFQWAYIPQGTDRSQPLLSPIFAEREKLPPKICLFGCEYDMLCKEAEDMAEGLAKKESTKRVFLEEGEGWEGENVRWEKIKGQEHGFDHMPVGGNKVKEATRAKASDGMHDRAASWLFRKVYS